MHTRITTRQLLEEAMASIDEAGTRDEPAKPILLESPPSSKPGHGGQVEWDPLIALAVAGHISQHWSIGWRQKSPFEIEAGRPVGYAATLLDRGDSGSELRRLEAGGYTGEIWVRELCGHIGCTEDAPAGPGSRCHSHFADPHPYQPAIYWAQIAAEAWGRQHPTFSEWHRVLDNERNGLVRGAIAAGVDPDDLHRWSEIPGEDIDRIINPKSRPAPSWDGDGEDVV